MCHAVTILVPRAHAEWFERQKWLGLTWGHDESWASRGLRSRAGSTWRMYHVPRDNCSCGWFTSAQKPEEVDVDERMKQYLRRGWSVAKARRAVEQAELAGAHPAGGPTPGFASSVVEAVTRVAEHAGSCGVIAEWMGGSDAIKFEVGAERSCTVAEWPALTDFVEGSICWVSASPAHRDTASARHPKSLK